MELFLNSVPNIPQVGSSDMKRFSGPAGLIKSAVFCVGLALAGFVGAEPTVLEEVVVTAEKRTTNLQDTAMSISAISGDELALRQIDDIGSLALSVPNVNFGETTGNARIAIRGIGFDNISLGNEGRVAFHVDDVYLSRPAAALSSFFDLERVEVLRGPQGFLYGRNATAGAINLITRAPGDALNGYTTLTVANYDRVTLEGAVGGPLSDRVGARIAFRSTERDGWGDNLTNGREVDDESTRAVRGMLSFAPADGLEIILRGDYFEQDDNAYSFRYLGLGSLPDASVGWPGLVPTGLRAGGTVPDDPRDSTADSGPENEREFYGASLDLSWDVGDYNVRSISGFRSNGFETITDLDNTSVPLTIYYQFSDSDHFSQEFRLSSEGDFGDWMVGAYYFDEKLTAATKIPLDPFLIPPLGLAAPIGLRRGFVGVGAIDTEAWALFGHFRWQATDRLAMRLGARYSDEKKSIDEINQIDLFTPYPPFGPEFPPTPPGGRVQSSETWDDFTPSVTLEYQAGDDVLAYFDYSHGFKSGGYNLGNLQPAFDPEEITQYEIGLRSEWRDRSVRANVSAFFYDYKDLQVSKVDGTVVTIENAAKADLYGLEFELIALLGENLLVETAVGFLDTEYQEYRTADPSRPAFLFGEFDLSGNELTQAPGYTVNIGAEYRAHLAEGTLVFRGDARFVDDVWLTAFNADHIKQDAYEWLKASITYESANANWALAAFVDNITDARIISAALITSALVGAPIAGAFESPRTYGASMTFRF